MSGSNLKFFIITLQNFWDTPLFPTLPLPYLSHPYWPKFIKNHPVNISLNVYTYICPSWFLGKGLGIMFCLSIGFLLLAGLCGTIAVIFTVWLIYTELWRTCNLISSINSRLVYSNGVHHVNRPSFQNLKRIQMHHSSQQLIKFTIFHISNKFIKKNKLDLHF